MSASSLERPTTQDQKIRFPTIFFRHEYRFRILGNVLAISWTGGGVKLFWVIVSPWLLTRESAHNAGIPSALAEAPCWIGLEVFI